MTTLMVQTDRILYNLRLFKKAVGKAGVIPLLSGNAYGVGDEQMARLLFANGYRLVAVSRIEEAVRVKNAVAGLDVLLLTPYATESVAQEIVRHGIIATIGSYDSAVILNGIAAAAGKRARIHFKFDTGSGRFGFMPQEVGKAVQAAKYLPNLALEGIYTHVSASDCKHEKRVKKQYQALKGMLAVLRREGISYGTVHAANSLAALTYPWLRLDAVRCGSAMVGRMAQKDRWGFKKVGRLVSEVIDVRWVPAHYNVGYGSTYKTKKPTQIALVPTGFADGLCQETVVNVFKFRHIFRYIGAAVRRAFTGRRTYCDIGGKPARILGYVDHETVMVDVTKIECAPGAIVSFDTRPAQVDGSVRRAYV
ncbi:alanine racemase [Neobittarella massiliensis]|uniref:Alanine racemase n=2 Tax=Oscillospiraceae TaxID=216572 RepID=A0A8J6IHV7_9FIRM|nr:alanine racemase [Neobittarella massiliensis]MBC3517385.1 alanine racemase [Neobittarella massiliensis]SCJ91317.1 Alanine racemase 1 [uncultured Anaerotruncus sp.]